MSISNQQLSELLTGLALSQLALIKILENYGGAKVKLDMQKELIGLIDNSEKPSLSSVPVRALLSQLAADDISTTKHEKDTHDLVKKFINGDDTSSFLV